MREVSKSEVIINDSPEIYSVKITQILTHYSLIFSNEINQFLWKTKIIVNKTQASVVVVSDAVLSYYTGNQQLTLTVNSTKNPGREFIKGRSSPMSTTPQVLTVVFTNKNHLLLLCWVVSSSQLTTVEVAGLTEAVIRRGAQVLQLL